MCSAPAVTAARAVNTTRQCCKSYPFADRFVVSCQDEKSQLKEQEKL